MQGKILANAEATDRNKQDFYPTPENVTIALIKRLQIPKTEIIWECACGKGHMAKVFSESGYTVLSSDLNDNGFGESGIDFLKTNKVEADIIITNPPFKLAEKFIRHCIQIGKPFALLLKSQYWHSAKRRKLFEAHKPEYIFPLTWRPDFLFGQKGGSPTMECLWTVWGNKSSVYTIYEPLPKPVVPPYQGWNPEV